MLSANCLRTPLVISDNCDKGIIKDLLYSSFFSKNQLFLAAFELMRNFFCRNNKVAELVEKVKSIDKQLL